VSARRKKDQRGVAMLIAIISIAILTVVATEFAFNSRVDLELAANQRDSLQAYYLARSGLGLSRLLLKFQKQLNSTPIPNLGAILGAVAGGQGGGAPQGAQPSTMNLQIWRLAKVDCHMLRGMVKSQDDDSPGGGARSRAPSRKLEFDEEFPDVARAQQKVSFGGFEGCFNTTITDEEEKLNLMTVDSGALTAGPLVGRLIDLFGDKRFEFLFDHEDANGVKATPQEVIIAVKDWIDEDEVQSALNLTGQSPDPFLKGFSDENYHYDKYTPRYPAKNARFDSLDELYMVHGVSDQFMAAFKDRLTVYPKPDAKPNVNTDDPMLLYMDILSVADPARPDPRLRDPLFISTLIKQIRAARMFSFVGFSVADFVNVVQSAGVAVNSSITSGTSGNKVVSDKSETYRVSVVGEAGNVQKTITAVIRLDDQLGKLVYWRED
jgi:general secretion pathway protein K